MPTSEVAQEPLTKTVHLALSQQLVFQGALKAGEHELAVMGAPRVWEVKRGPRRVRMNITLNSKPHELVLLVGSLLGKYENSGHSWIGI